jgi:hypothetical protein
VHYVERKCISVGGYISSDELVGGKTLHDLFRYGLFHNQCLHAKQLLEKIRVLGFPLGFGKWGSHSKFYYHE